MCTHQYAKDNSMPARKVGIREFREKLATFLLESDEPVAITRHGDTVGYYLPARPRRSHADHEALKEAASRLQSLLTAQGISEDEIIRDFRRWRSAKRK
jgi:PHD/YefM family antitoxin component YafN of YafNO toxin-antitoxin module